MQQLHLVGFTTDRRGLIFSVRRGAKSGGYTIAVDDDLFNAIDDARAWVAEAVAAAEEAKPPADERPESQLSVREVQSRLRQGWSVDEVANDAGVDPAWVARFAAPVLTEQASVIRAVRAGRLTKRTGVSSAPLGDAVYRNLAERGFTPPRDQLDRQWSARQLAEGLWEVEFAYTFRRREHQVRWTYDTEQNKVTPRDRLAALLGFRSGAPPPTQPRPRPMGVVGLSDIDERPPPPKRRAQEQKRFVAARKAAAATMAAEAKKAGRRNAAVARKAVAAKRPMRAAQPAPATPKPAPAKEPPAAEPQRERAARPSTRPTVVHRSRVEPAPPSDRVPEPEVKPRLTQVIVEESRPESIEEPHLAVPASAPAAEEWLPATWDGFQAAQPPPRPASPARRREPLRATRIASPPEPAAAPDLDALELSRRLVRIRDDLAARADISTGNSTGSSSGNSSGNSSSASNGARVPPRRRRQLRAR